MVKINQTVTLDVREDIRSGREPFSKILSTVAALPGGAELLLIAPFEPVPLFAVMAKQGFDHVSRPSGSGDWEVRFTPRAQDLSRLEPAATTASVSETGDQQRIERMEPWMPKKNVVEVDARGLEPPQPLVKILETLAGLPEGADLKARTDRRPMHLYAQLGERGFIAETQEEPDGSFLTYVRRH